VSLPAKEEKKYPHKECKKSKGDCNECEYEGCEAWGVGYADEDDET
jgi:hypothetical protein